MQRILNLMWKEIIQLFRDRMLTTFLFMLPILQLILLAQAIGRGIDDLRVAVLDLDQSAVSRALTVQLDNREELWVRYFVDSEEQLYELLDRGQADVAVILPLGLSQALDDPGRPAEVRAVLDGSNNLVGSVGLGAVSSVLLSYRHAQFAKAGLDVSSPVELRVTTYYNSTYDTRHFSIPAQVGFITYQITLAVASLGLARERELGTMEQLVVTPLRGMELVLGKATPAMLIGAANFLLMLGVTVYFFQIPMRGSVLLLFVITLFFLLCEIGWGLLISAISRTQQQAILFVFIMAMVDITFSGYMVPVKNLPTLFQWIARIVPMYHYLVLIRAVMLKGAGLAATWSHVLALILLGAAILTVAVWGVSRQFD